MTAGSVDLTVFYSWQDDRPRSVCKHFIRDAAKAAVSRISRDVAVEDAPRLEHDTKAESGMPAIADTILSKIDGAGVFLGDLTLVGSSDCMQGQRPKGLPNPNVLVELGYAAKSIGWERIVCVSNAFYGDLEHQFFNIRHRRRPLVYTIGPDDGGEIGSIRDQLSRDIEQAVRLVLRAGHKRVTDILSKLDADCQTFLQMHAALDVITPRPTSEFRLGAPAGDLDTPSYKRAVDQLRQLDVIRTQPDTVTHTVTFAWTYMGYLVLQALGLRQDMPTDAR